MSKTEVVVMFLVRPGLGAVFVLRFLVKVARYFRSSWQAWPLVTSIVVDLVVRSAVLFCRRVSCDEES